jgi:hypothetical protein
MFHATSYTKPSKIFIGSAKVISVRAYMVFAYLETYIWARQGNKVINTAVVFTTMKRFMMQATYF